MSVLFSQSLVGSVNGSNCTFSLPSDPSPTSFCVIRDGLRCWEGLTGSLGYSISGLTLVFNEAPEQFAYCAVAIASIYDSATSDEQEKIRLSETDATTGSQSAGRTGAPADLDHGGGTDRPSIAPTIPVSQEAAGAQAIKVSGEIDLSESAAGADSARLPTFPAAETDAAHGVDRPSEAVAPQDAARGQDTPEDTAHVSETGTASGADIVLGSLQDAVNDSGSGADTSNAPDVIAPASNSATGAQTEKAAPVMPQDAATGEDTPSAIAGAATVDDSARGADTPSAVVRPGDVSDSAAGADAAHVAGYEVEVADTARGAAAIGPPSGSGPTIQEPATEAAAGAETISIEAKIDIADSASGAQQPSENMPAAAVSDSAIGLDMAVLARQVDIPYYVVWY